jgi:metallo-beta-lactamase family protein
MGNSALVCIPGNYRQRAAGRIRPPPPGHGSFRVQRFTLTPHTVHIEFHGAAREVTGSCHILRVGGRTVLLDCGLFQGRRSETNARNRALPVPVDEIDAVVLSHAHIDHAGRLPFLAAQGFRGRIYATPATRDLCAIMLADSANIQNKDAEFLRKRGRDVLPPLYGIRDVADTMSRMIGVPYGTPFDVTDGVRVTFSDAGHILGSASLAIECREGGATTRLVFSGDVGRSGLPIIRDPNPPAGADVVIMESTYGNRDHVAVADMPARLAEIVRQTAARGGRVMIPSFAVGRTQELVYDLHALARDGAIPEIPIYIDSPLAKAATGVFAMHPELFDAEEELIGAVADIFDHPQVHFTRDVTESRALNAQRGPMVVIAASGMVESGRILHHLAHHAHDPRNTILIVGFQAQHTLGRRIVERQPMLRIFGDEVPLRASVEVLTGYSAHADRTELRHWLRTVRGGERSPRVYLVHGEAEAQAALQEQLEADGFAASAPAPGSMADLGG